jgi:hypothetical protein
LAVETPIKVEAEAQVKIVDFWDADGFSYPRVLLLDGDNNDIFLSNVCPGRPVGPADKGRVWCVDAIGNVLHRLYPKKEKKKKRKKKKKKKERKMKKVATDSCDDKKEKSPKNKVVHEEKNSKLQKRSRSVTLSPTKLQFSKSSDTPEIGQHQRERSPARKRTRKTTEQERNATPPTPSTSSLSSVRDDDDGKRKRKKKTIGKMASTVPDDQVAN